MTTTDYRLSDSVTPIDYDVDLDVSPRRSGFEGSLTLAARVMRKTDVIELHARGLKVSAAEATQRKRRQRARVVTRPERETIELVFGEPLRKGRVLVVVRFKGKLNPNMHGLYLARDGADRAIVSQCEATDARAIFPCFDEPAFKATLRWTVRTDPGLEVVTNGVPESRRKAKGRVVHRFRRTRVISSYLAAIAVGKLEATKTRRVSRIPCRVLCGPGKLEQTGFAEEVTAQVLPWYEQYFGQRYNYQKLDQVAVPGFDAGAMENVGAVFYRQSLLLMQPELTSWAAQKRIAEVIAHEIAHMWFGNLVTMRWWDDLWLNEAFATWIAYKAVDLWQPAWRMWDDYFSSRESALAADALLNTHPIYSAVKSPAEATELFDVITYEKGCAVLRMAEAYLGEESFRQGIRSYVAKFKNANAAGADLWNALGEASGEPVGALMQSWISQPGFPLVIVSGETERGRTRLTLSQKRFLANRDEMQRSRAQLWNIPIVIRYDDGDGTKTHRVLLDRAEATVELPAAAQWVYPNADAAGFYRTQLDDDLVRDILRTGLPKMTATERASLIEDQWALVRNGISTIDRFMDVLTALGDEHDYVVTRSIAARLHYLDNFLVETEDRPNLQRFARRLFARQLEELDWDGEPGESPARAVRRATVLSILGEVGRDSDILGEAERRLELEIDDPAAIEPNVAGVLVRLAALRGDAALLQRYVEVYQKRKRNRASPELQARYLGALGSFEEPKVVGRVLELCLDGTVPQEQLRTLLSPLLYDRATGPTAWAFLKKHWKSLAPRIGAMSIARLVEETGGLPVDLRDDVAKFFAKNPVDGAKRAVERALEALDLRRELIDREARRLADWLSEKMPAVEATT